MNQDLWAIKTLKVSGVAAINKANSGHPGIVLGAAPIMHTLFTKHLKYDPLHPQWINRDRFILSAGHGSALLYAQLRLLNLVSTNQLKQFRQLHSLTPGHPEFNLTPGVEATTGPLGQGIAIAVGLALGETMLRARFNEIDHYTYVLCGDGDLEEGVAMEALSFAGKNQLHKLIILHDSNDIQLDTPVKAVFNENLELKMKALGFNYIFVPKAEVALIDQALIKAKQSSKPTFIEVKTIIGQGATKAGTTAVHGAPLGADFEQLKTALEWDEDDFWIPQVVKDLYQETIFQRGKKAYQQFVYSTSLTTFLKHQPLKINLELKPNQATRVTSGQVINYIGNHVPSWIGGSADLSASTKAQGNDGVWSQDNPLGRNLLFGVREFAMAAIANGLALHSHWRPFVSTFFVFSDYLKPALRLGALMSLPVIYVFTHDSVYVGEDGPTHEPIEQLAMIRSIPNVNLFRPADEKEVIGAYEEAFNTLDRPSAIVLTRQNIESLPTTNSSKVRAGAYLIHKSKSPWTIIGTGSELAKAYHLGQKYNLNVISLVNSSLAKITWNPQKAISIEAGSTFGWGRYARHNIGIDQFGLSAPGETIIKEFKLDLPSLEQRIEQIINQK